MYTQDPWLMQHERAVVRFVQQNGVGIRVTSRVRTFEQQERLYCERRHMPVPAAKPGRSQHEYGLAYDLVPDRNALRTKFGATFAEGLAWVGAVAEYYGAHFIVEPDHVHVQAFPSNEWTAYLDSCRMRDPVGGVELPCFSRQPRCDTRTFTDPVTGQPIIVPESGGRIVPGPVTGLPVEVGASRGLGDPFSSSLYAAWLAYLAQFGAGVGVNPGPEDEL